jgi:hypothetical protein
MGCGWFIALTLLHDSKPSRSGAKGDTNPYKHDPNALGDFTYDTDKVAMRVDVLRPDTRNDRLQFSIVLSNTV